MILREKKYGLFDIFRISISSNSKAAILIIIIKICNGIIPSPVSYTHLSLEVVQNAFSGIRVAVAVLIVKAIINLWQTGIKDIGGVVIFIIALSASILLDFSPIYIVIGAVIAGIILNSFRKEPQ